MRYAICWMALWISPIVVSAQSAGTFEVNITVKPDYDAKSCGADIAAVMSVYDLVPSVVNTQQKLSVYVDLSASKAIADLPCVATVKASK